MKADKRVLIIGGVLLVALVPALIWKFGSQPKPVEVPVVVESESFPPFPSPNGYGALLQAADNTRAANGDVRSMGRGSLEVYLSGHEDAFKIARTAFEQPSRVILDGVVEFSPGYEDELASFQRLANLFLAQGLHAESRIKMKEALESYLEILQVGAMAGRGGWAPHWQTAAAIVDAGSQSIEGLVRRLSKSDVKVAQEAVGKICDAWETADERREWGRLLDVTIHADTIGGLNADQLSQRKENREAAIEASSLQLDKLRILWLRLAMRLYEFQNGDLPESLTSLVPDQVMEIPRRALTGEPFVLADLD